MIAGSGFLVVTLEVVIVGATVMGQHPTTTFSTVFTPVVSFAVDITSVDRVTVDFDRRILGEVRRTPFSFSILTIALALVGRTGLVRLLITLVMLIMLSLSVAVAL